MDLNVIKLEPHASLPEYSRDADACMDVRTIEEAWVAPGQAYSYRTGLAVEVPAGYALLVFSRSGHGAKHGLRLANCVGVIDPGYQGELLVTLRNDSRTPFGFAPGDRIAQIALVPMPKVQVREVAEFSQPSERGAAGHGSSGDK